MFSALGFRYFLMAFSRRMFVSRDGSIDVDAVFLPWICNFCPSVSTLVDGCLLSKMPYHVID